MFDAIGRFAATFLVLRNSGRFLNKDPHVFGLRLNQPRNHALLDNRVAARPQPGSQEYTRNVLATAFGVIQVVTRDAVSTNLASNRDLRILGVLAIQGRIAVVEQQLH